MIIYSKSFGGLPLALRFGRGSPLTRNLLWPLLSCALTAVLFQFTCKKVAEPLSALEGDDGGDGEMPGQCVVKWMFHPYPVQMYATFLGFLIVFRINMSIARYWEGRTAAETARIRWADACMQLVLFDEGARSEAAAYSEAALAWRARIVHLFSLLHAVAVQYLRDDMELDNLLPAGAMTADDGTSAAASTPLTSASGKIPATVVSAGTSPRQQRSSGRVNSARLASDAGDDVAGDVWLDAPRGSSAAATSAGAVRVVPTLGPRLLPPQHAEPPLRALPLLSAFILRWGPRANAAFNAAVPLPVLGGVSAAERAALAATHARVRLVQSWVVRAMGERMADSDGLLIGTKHPHTPIITRVYQLMSEATHAFAQARKITETPFPFPHAQLISLSLIVFCLMSPLVCVAWVADLWLAMLLNAASVFAFVSANEVATDLEDPFIGPPNNVALATMHAHFNEDMLSYGHEYAAALQSSGVAASGAVAAATALPPAAARAAAAARRAQGGGPGVAVEWAGSPYTALRCYLVPTNAANEDATLHDAQQPADVAAALPPRPPTSPEGVRRSASAGAHARARSSSPGGARPPSPAAALHREADALRFYA